MKEEAENPASTVCTLFLQFHLHMIFSLGAPWSCPVNDEIRKNFKKGGANFYLVKIRLNGTELKSCWKKLFPFCFRDGLLQEADGVFCGSADVSGKSSLSKSAGERAFFPAMQQLSCVFIFNISQTTFRALSLSLPLFPRTCLKETPKRPRWLHA